MGIFEIIIFIAAAVIFIILARRFPDTSPDATPRSNKRGFSMSHVPTPQSANRFAALRTLLPTAAKQEASQEVKTESHTNEQVDVSAPENAAQHEPGMSPRDVEKLSAKTRQLLSDAHKFFDAGHLDQAEKLYLQAAADNPSCTAAYNRLGMIYLQKSDSLDDAEEALKQAQKFEPENGYILNNLGLAAFQKGKFNEAVAFYDRSIAADPNIASRHANLGLAYLSMRQYANAVRNLARAWSIEPYNEHYKELLDDAKTRERKNRAAKR